MVLGILLGVFIPYPSIRLLKLVASWTLILDGNHLECTCRTTITIIIMNVVVLYVKLLLPLSLYFWKNRETIQHIGEKNEVLVCSFYLEIKKFWYKHPKFYNLDTYNFSWLTKKSHGIFDNPEWCNWVPFTFLENNW